MISRNDPRIRRTIEQITQNLEVANERTQENIFTFTQHYIKPCLASIGEHTRSCTVGCCPGDEERRRRHRQKSRGQAESSFDFYDDWEADETDALLGLSNSENNERAGPSGRQPLRRRQMSYGTTIPSIDGDTKNIHSSSYFGFLERFPFRLGAKGFTYKPSIADLQDHPGLRKEDDVDENGDAEEQQPLLEDDLPIAEASRRTHKRNRSGTQGSNNSGLSGVTTDSFSSRGDIFPSEDEMDDAIPIDDEFALHFERRSAGYGMDESVGALSKSSRKSSSTHSLSTVSRKRPSIKSQASSSQDIRQGIVAEPSNTFLSNPLDTTVEDSNDVVEQSTDSIPKLLDMPVEDSKVVEQEVEQEDEQEVEQEVEQSIYPLPATLSTPFSPNTLDVSIENSKPTDQISESFKSSSNTSFNPATLPHF